MNEWLKEIGRTEDSEKKRDTLKLIEREIEELEKSRNKARTIKLQVIDCINVGPTGSYSG